MAITDTKYLNIPPWGSEEARRKEMHVARFLEREYKAAMDLGVTLESLGVSASTGPMWEETEELIETHYDEQIEFFDSFLDARYRAYSMAYYGEDAEEVNSSSLSLEDAQERKFDLICKRIGIIGNERILNIGCGFGSFEKYILKRYPDVEIIGVTPSDVQVNYLSKSINDSNHVFSHGAFSVIHKDFSKIEDDELQPESFDLITSIGLLEQVKNMDVLNEKIASLLKPGGMAFHHFIVSKMPIPQFLDASETLIGSYFPGGRIWPQDEFCRHTEHLEIKDSWFINGRNYWRTLDEWHKRFWRNMEKLSVHLDSERIEYWNDYFILCKACFLPKNGELFGNAHYLFQKPA